MKFKPVIKHSAIFYFLLSILIFSCIEKTPITENNIADCSTIGLIYSENDLTNCECIDYADWIHDSTV